ncbi:MAG: AgmX/PglI C-terminal domain-containing protein [Myxococcota bacterium]|nr:AgmX/PglI C-terminal domain-containing protein [Myxococcota bacterium]
MQTLLLILPALAHGPSEPQVMAASLDEHERYILPEPLPEDSSAVITVGPAEVMGSYNRQTIAAALEDLTPATRVCYQFGLDDAEHPAGTGRIVFQTTMYATGMKTAFTIGTNTLHHPEVEDCVARVLKTVDLPKPLRGVITLSIPVDFGGRAEQGSM